jgi:hypothetical protein
MSHVTFTVQSVGMVDLAAVNKVKSCIFEAFTGIELDVEVVGPSLEYKISTDHDSFNPRTDNDNLGVMHCAHKKYDLGDKDAPTPFVDDDYRAGVLRDDVLVSKPIYMYDHSGITVRHTPFDCQWDSGLLGWHYMLKSVAEENWPSQTGDELIASVEACLKAEIEEYDAYIQGDVWYVEITDEEGEVIDSCGCFIGSDLDSTGILDNFDTKYHDGLREAWENRLD